LAPLAFADPANTAATELVRRQHLGSNLKTIALATAVRTQTFAILVKQMGVSKAQAVVSTELDAHAREYEGRWDQNLASAYAQHFTSEELASLASEGRNSRYVRKLGEQQGAVGASMERLSKPLLVEYVSASMNSAFSKSMGK
jgi:hypothetical protein